MYRFILILLTFFFPTHVISKGDTSWLNTGNSYDCSVSLEQCFIDDFMSNDDSKVVDAILLYLDNISELSQFYDKEKFMEELSKKSRKNKKQAFLIEASIYFYGEHFNQNYDKAIEIIESSQFFSESEPEQLIILGQSYYFKYILSDMTSSSFYFKAKKYLRKSYELDSGYATRELAFLLIRSESLDDLEIAGDIFEIFANEGKEEDIRNYKAYLRAIEN